MSFGLTNAPALFQRLMATLFAGKEWSFVFVYLDNQLIVSKSIAEHVEHLRKVFQRLEAANLKLKPQKYKIQLGKRSLFATDKEASLHERKRTKGHLRVLISVTVYFLFEVYAVIQFIFQEFDGT